METGGQVWTGGLTVEAEPRKLGLKRQGDGEPRVDELDVLFPAERWWLRGW